ncbi:MAG: hypothetical protein HC900_06385 [Methylacidiphilales bacterium]|nr:hypothetical protein [Candidatus Methylacidiphilales bacterium]
MMLTILTAQIGHYHHARYEAVAKFANGFSVVAVANEADFAEFMSGKAPTYPVTRLFAGTEEYRAAARTQAVWRETQRALDQLAPDIIALARGAVRPVKA